MNNGFSLVSLFKAERVMTALRDSIERLDESSGVFGLWAGPGHLLRPLRTANPQAQETGSYMQQGGSN